MAKKRLLSGDKTRPYVRGVSEKSQMGRPPVFELTDDVLRQLRGLSRLRCTKRQVAQFFEVSESTLYEFLRREPDAEMAYSRGLGLSAISLRATQLRLAEKSPRMAIFLGKQLLGQTERGRKAAKTGDIKMLDAEGQNPSLKASVVNNGRMRRQEARIWRLTISIEP